MVPCGFEDRKRRISEQAATSPTEPVRGRAEAMQRVILPPNLSEALKNLHDDQLQLVLKDVSLEIERRKSAALPEAPPVEATRQWQRGRHRNQPPWQATPLMKDVNCLRARPI